ncbi:hypothetical protein DY000_02056911 [Brassica cretica]|uniref:Secreted protein n=1 Tax=Brassica cretica TaxID=69181 RepID=A0ABQ7ADB7_BRACR|nr:hypothetical protein DY000_02056911 [Brassica cretica]
MGNSLICSGGCQPGAWPPKAPPSPFSLCILLCLFPLSPTWCSGEIGSVYCRLRSGFPVRRAIVLAACRGAVDSFSWSSGSCSKSYLRCGEEYRAPFHFGLWSCRLVKGLVSCSWKVVVVYCLRVHRGVAAVWWSQVCWFVRVAAVRSQVPAVHGCAPLFLTAALPLFQPSPFYLIWVLMVLGGLLKSLSSQCVEPDCFRISGPVAAVASVCSFRVAFQASCGVNYKPDFGGDCKAVVCIWNSLLLLVLRFIDSDGYKLCGVHRELATPETTREFPPSEATRRTSHFP